MRRLVVLAMCLAPATAGAEVFKLYGEANLGGMYGTGTAGTPKDDAFFADARGGAYGLMLGAKLLFFDIHASHHQFISPDIRTWTQGTVGLSFGMDTGSEWDHKQGTGGYLEFGFGVGFGVGTGAQVDPPLDNGQLTDKGILLEGRFGFGKHLSSVFDLGLTLPISYGFFYKTGAGANEADNQYQSVQIEALIVLRANLRLI